MCDARIMHLGKRVGHASAVVTNEDGKEIALGDSTIMITLGEPAANANRRRCALCSPARSARGTPRAAAR